MTVPMVFAALIAVSCLVALVATWGDEGPGPASRSLLEQDRINRMLAMDRRDQWVARRAFNLDMARDEEDIAYELRQADAHRRRVEAEMKEAFHGRSRAEVRGDTVGNASGRMHAPGVDSGVD